MGSAVSVGVSAVTTSYGASLLNFVTMEGVAVVTKERKLVTAWGKNYFDENMKIIIKRLFGEGKMSKIDEIINEWDPIDLFPMAPSDEYWSEIEKVKLLLAQKDLQLEEIANKLEQIFVSAFGDDVFLCTKEECMDIAKKLKSSL